MFSKKWNKTKRRGNSTFIYNIPGLPAFHLALMQISGNLLCAIKIE